MSVPVAGRGRFFCSLGDDLRGDAILMHIDVNGLRLAAARATPK
jgi:hypothetical protein